MSSHVPGPICVEITHRHPKLCVAERLLRLTVEQVCAAEEIGSADISLVLTDDLESQRINRDHLQHDYPTDVISFSLSAGDRSGEPAAGAEPELQGELIVNLDIAEAVARSQGWSLEAEVVLYVLHGLLHLCGYEDHTDETRLIMRTRERDILSELNLPAGMDPTVSGWDQLPS